MIESEFQKRLKKELKERYPDSYVLKTDCNDIQGMPDLLILYKNKWAALEVKKNKTASHRPNQDYHVERLNKMSYSAFIYPENKEEIFNDLDHAFRIKRTTRVVQS